MNQKLKGIIEAGEGYHTEFKQSFDKSLVESVCAFANASGGKVILGISDSGKIIGIDTSNKVRSNVQNALRQLKPHLNIKIEVKANIIVIDIPNGKNKPYSCPRGFFMRMGANTQKLEGNEIIEFYKSEGRIRFEELICKEANFKKDFDSEAFNNFLDLAHITPTIGHKDLLKNLGCLDSDNSMTNLGVLFFCKDIDFIMNDAIIRCILFRGTENIDIIDDKSYKKGLVENIDNALGFIQRHTNVEVVVAGKTLRSERIPDYPEEMLREAIVNAVSHRDYFDKSSQTVIKVFSNRVEISNPGGLPKNLDPKDFGKKSVTRNPRIAAMLNRIDYVERAGTGIKRMKQMAKNHKKKVRVKIEHSAYYDITFYKKMQKEDTEKAHRKYTENIPKIYRKYTENIPKDKNKSIDFSDLDDSRFRYIFGINLEEFRSLFSENTLKIAWLIYNNPEMTAKEMAKKLSVTQRTVENCLSQLKEAQYIERSGSRKIGVWKVLKSKK